MRCKNCKFCGIEDDVMVGCDLRIFGNGAIEELEDLANLNYYGEEGCVLRISEANKLIQLMEDLERKLYEYERQKPLTDSAKKERKALREKVRSYIRELKLRHNIE